VSDISYTSSSSRFADNHYRQSLALALTTKIYKMSISSALFVGLSETAPVPSTALLMWSTLQSRK